MHPLVFKVPTELPRNGASFGHDTRVWGPQSMALMGQGGSSPWFVRELKQFWTMIALSKNKTSTVLLVMWRWVESFFWYLKTGRWHMQKMNRSFPIFYRALSFTHRNADVTSVLLWSFAREENGEYLHVCFSCLFYSCWEKPNITPCVDILRACRNFGWNMLKHSWSTFAWTSHFYLGLVVSLV
jgi:hypothetical protein